MAQQGLLSLAVMLGQHTVKGNKEWLSQIIKKYFQSLSFFYGPSGLFATQLPTKFSQYNVNKNRMQQFTDHVIQYLTEIRNISNVKTCSLEILLANTLQNVNGL